MMHNHFDLGDIVKKRGATNEHLGVVVGVRRSNNCVLLPETLYSYVYYVFFLKECVIGPLFKSELDKL